MSPRTTTVQLDDTHCRAICNEIGERLREVLGRDMSDIPLSLLVLIDRLAQLDDAPSLVPCIDDMASPLHARAPHPAFNRIGSGINRGQVSAVGG